MKVMWDEWQNVYRGYRKGHSHVWLQIEVALLIGGICLILYNALTFIDAFANESPEIFRGHFLKVYSGGAILFKIVFLYLFVDFLIKEWQLRKPHERIRVIIDLVIVMYFVLVWGQSIGPYIHYHSYASLFTGITHIQAGDCIYILIACILMISIYTGLSQMFHPGGQNQIFLSRAATTLYGAFLFLQMIKIGGLPMKFFQFGSVFTVNDYSMIHRLLISWWIVIGLTLIYMLPHSFTNELPRAIDRSEVWNRSRQGEYSAMGRLVSLHFLRHVIGEKGTGMIVGIILHTSGCLLLLKYSNAGSAEDYAQLIMRIVPAFILSGAAAILEPIATGWRGRREVFRAQMGRSLLNQVLGSMSEHLVVMGYGNLGSSVVAKQWAVVERTHSYSLSSDFEVVVEPSLRLRPIYKKIAIVDINPDCLLEKHEVGGITVGIAPLYAHAMLAVGSNHRDQYRKTNDYLSYYASSINFAAVCGDGGGQETLRVARGYTAKTMVCAINRDYWYEQCLGDRQHLNINEENRNNKYSPIILKVNHGSMYRQLQRLQHIGQFPYASSFFYPQIDEAENLIRYAEVVRGVPIVEQVVVIIGSRRRLYHAARSIICSLKFTEAQRRAWCAKHLWIISSGDKTISGYYESRNQNHIFGQWVIDIMRMSTPADRLNTYLSPHIEFSELKRCIEDIRAINGPTTHITILAFCDSQSYIFPVICDVEEALAMARNTSCMSVCASVSCRDYAFAHALEKSNVRMIQHDEVMSAELSSEIESVDIYGAQIKSAQQASTKPILLEMYFCESDAPGMLLCKSLICAGYTIDQVREFMGALEGDYPSFKYYFSESNVSVMMKGKSKNACKGFRFRASVCIYKNIRFNYDVRDVAIFSYDWKKTEGEQQSEKMIICKVKQAFGANTSSLTNTSCALSCPLLHQMDADDRAPQMLDLTPENPASATPMFNIDVLCVETSSAGEMAKMLSSLMLIDLTDMNPKRSDFTIDLRHMNSNEYCGTRRTCSQFTGFYRKYSGDAPYPRNEKTPAILSISIEYSSRLENVVLQYAEKLLAHLNTRSNIQTESNNLNARTYTMQQRQKMGTEWKDIEELHAMNSDDNCYRQYQITSSDYGE